MFSTISERSAAALSALVVAAVAVSAGAQSRIVLDGSLGSAGGGAREIGANGPELFIPATDGRERGDALFHSFSVFDLRADDRAVFGVSPETARIISRVTGGEGAFIDGRVRTNQRAGVDFWMISPGGLILGPNAEFNTNGAIHLSTGDTLTFADGAVFSADPSGALTLTTAAPAAFGFNDGPGRLEVRGDGLEIVRGDLTLAGGAVDIGDARIGANSGAQILIAGAAEGDVLTLDRRRADAPPAGRATLGGEIRIIGDAAAPAGEATRIEFDGAGVIALEGRRVRIEGAEVALGAVGTQSGGDGVLISARRVEIVGDGAVRTFTGGAADAGDVAVTGFERLLIDRAARTGAFPGETAIESETRGAGAAGDVFVSGERIIVRNRGRISSNTLSSGAAGDVGVSVVSLRLLSGGQIGSGALDPQDGPMAEDAGGVGGALRVRASEVVRISGLASAPAAAGDSRADEPSGLFTSTEATAGGDAGVVSVRTPTLILADDGEIASETRNQSDAGRISIRADRVALTGSAEITTNVVDPRAPEGGEPAGESLVLGNAGDIRVLRFSDGGATTLTLGADTAIASDGSLGLRSRAGAVVIRRDRVEIGAGAQIATNASTDAGGDITIVGRDLVRIESAVTTSVEDGDGDGGQILISGDLVLAPGGARIQANAGDVGDGGRVRIETGVFLRDFAGTVVEARGSGGAPGSILILGDAGADTGEAAELDSAFLDAFALVDDFCVAAVTGGSSLVLTTLSAPPGGGAPTPALFGSAIPMPMDRGVDAVNGIGRFHDLRPCDPG